MSVRSLVLIAAVFSSTMALPAGAAFTYHYQGTIGDRLQVEMQFTWKDDGKIAGSYRYANFGQELVLEQTAVEGGVVTFRESVARDDKITGSFRGKFDDGSSSFAGIWSSKDRKRSLPFSLHKVAESVELAAKQSDRYAVQVAYPKFDGAGAFTAAVNEQVRNEAQTHFDAILAEYKTDTAKLEPGMLPYEHTTTVEVVHATDKIISLLYQDDFYTGGLHPNSVLRCANYLWRNGKLHEATFNELIGGDAAVASRLNTLCVQSLKRQKAGWPQEIKFGVESSPVVTVTTGGLLFSFAPYEAGSYAEGTFSVLIPFKEFREQLNSASVLAVAE